MRTALAVCALVGLAMGCAGQRTASRPVPAVVSLTSAVVPAVRSIFVGEGSLEARGDSPGATTKLALQSVNIAAIASGDVAATTVEHVFRNDTDRQLEGTFRFPLPDEAIIVGLSLEMNDKLVDGELVERDKALKAYEETVDKMLDPALLEWENGQSFKLRVFPIEARKTKRVVVRFIAPLHRTPEGVFFAYRAPAPDSGLDAEHFTVTLDGKAVTAQAATRTPTGELLVKAGGVPSDIVVEHAKEGDYMHVRLDIVPADVPPPTPPEAQALVLLCDRSRSMLEARALEAKTASMLLGELGPKDRFTVVTGDVGVRALERGLRSATAADKQEAVAFVDATEPDGASDVARMLEAGGQAAASARAAGLTPVVVYLGDASPSWGETRATELARIAGEALGGAPLHVVLLGKSTDVGTARALTSATHGMLVRPKTEADAERAAEELARASRARRIDDVHLVGADGFDASELPGTIYEGEAVGLSLFAPKGVALAGLRVAGTMAGHPFAKTLDLAEAKPSRFVAQRWATAKIETLQRDGDLHKDEIVKTSLEHGVMSHYTSYLVLESEEAYARMNIERKAKAPAEEARVSGRDLESADGRTASVTPDHLQPGDPEVRIPAPADAQSVVVVFPFGDTKVATFEPDDKGGSWVTRFLVDRHTPDGTYEILVRITYASGAVEVMKIPYVVDTQGPHLDVRLVRHGAAFEIEATQVLTEDEIAAQSPPSSLRVDEKRARFAAILTDAKRVEVRTPDGQDLVLTHVTLGRFRGAWTPHGTVAPDATLHVVAVDRAENETEQDVLVP